MNDTERLDLLEEMMSKGENIHFRKLDNGDIELFTIVSQHIRGNSVCELIDRVAKEWERAGRKPEPKREGFIKRKGRAILKNLEKSYGICGGPW